MDKDMQAATKEQTCKACRGTGKVGKHKAKCFSCKGTGKSTGYPTKG